VWKGDTTEMFYNYYPVRAKDAEAEDKDKMEA
jgi:hypothetical protein